LSVAAKFTFVPYHVENWIFIIETNGAGILNFPLKIVKKIIELTSANYQAMLEKLYILNPSFMLKASWDLISGMIDPDTTSKISMLRKKDFYQLLDKIPIDQLEVKYGGKLPDTTTFWPPHNTLMLLPYTKFGIEPTFYSMKYETPAEILTKNVFTEIKVISEQKSYNTLNFMTSPGENTQCLQQGNEGNSHEKSSERRSTGTGDTLLNTEHSQLKMDEVEINEIQTMTKSIYVQELYSEDQFQKNDNKIKVTTYESTSTSDSCSSTVILNPLNEKAAHAAYLSSKRKFNLPIVPEVQESGSSIVTIEVRSPESDRLFIKKTSRRLLETSPKVSARSANETTTKKVQILFEKEENTTNFCGICSTKLSGKENKSANNDHKICSIF
jgi:hypothetical protein